MDSYTGVAVFTNEWPEETAKTETQALLQVLDEYLTGPVGSGEASVSLFAWRPTRRSKGT